MHSVGPANLSHTLAHSLSAPIVKVEYKIASSPPTGIHVFRKQRRFSRIWTVCPEQERMQFSLRFGVAVDIARPAGDSVDVIVSRSAKHDFGSGQRHFRRSYTWGKRGGCQRGAY